MAQLAAQQADILVTHEAPGYHPFGFTALDSLARSMGVRMTVHGHQHDSIDSSAHWDAQEFKSYGVGMRGLRVVDESASFLPAISPLLASAIGPNQR